MKKCLMLLALMVVCLSASAQFEKGKWIVNPSVSGLALNHNSAADRTSFGLQAQGGAFVADNLALLINLGAAWNAASTDMDIYQAGVGVRYYFDKVGIYMGGNVGVDRMEYGKDLGDRTLCSFGLEAGYAFFLSRTVTIEPAAYWTHNKDCSDYGLKVGFGFYF